MPTARIAALAYAPNEGLIDYLVNAVRTLPIEVRCNVTASAEEIAAGHYDHVIIATGAKRAAPEIPGKSQRHVFDGNELRGVLFGDDPVAIAKLNPFARLMLTAGRLSQLLRNIAMLRLLSRLWMPLADDIVIIGGDLVGLELAEYLVERRRRVTVLEPGPELGAKLSLVRRARVLHQLRENDVEIIENAEITAIEHSRVVYNKDGETGSSNCKQVIIAMGAQPDNRLVKQLENFALSGTVHSIGDCERIGYIDGAILAARKVVQNIATTTAGQGQ